MAPLRNTRVLFVEIPNHVSDLEKALKVDNSEEFDIDAVQLNGGLAVKILSMSIDPYLLARMKMAAIRTRLGTPTEAAVLGKPLDGFGVAVVLKSEDPTVSVGDHLSGFFPFAEYAVLPKGPGHLKVDRLGKHPWSVWVGVAGMPGRTAYHGYMEYIHDHAKKGDTLFVTTGAGAVGSLVVQLAKRQGLKVIASAGSEDKVKFAQECGADVAFNYKTTSTKEILAQHGPINFYWDHVGGESLDLALEAAAPFARFVICGLIAGYDSPHAPLKNYPNILFKSLNVQGFIASNLFQKYDGIFYKEVPPKVASGEIKYLEYTKRGVEETGEMLSEVLTGKNAGKAIVLVADG